MSTVSYPLDVYLNANNMSLDGFARQFKNPKSGKKVHKTTVKAAIDLNRQIHVVCDASTGKALYTVQVKKMWECVD